MTSKWPDYESEFSDAAASAEDLLRWAGDDPPPASRRLREQIVTRAQQTHRTLRREHLIWGGVLSLLLFLGGLIWLPQSSDSAVASYATEKTAEQDPSNASDSVDWQLVESKNELRRRHLEILRNAF